MKDEQNEAVEKILKR